MAIGERPGDAAAPIMARKVKARLAIAAGSDDGKRILHQAVHVIARGIARIWPRAF